MIAILCSVYLLSIMPKGNLPRCGSNVMFSLRAEEPFARRMLVPLIVNFGSKAIPEKVLDVSRPMFAPSEGPELIQSTRNILPFRVTPGFEAFEVFYFLLTTVSFSFLIYEILKRVSTRLIDDGFGIFVGILVSSIAPMRIGSAQVYDFMTLVLTPFVGMGMLKAIETRRFFGVWDSALDCGDKQRSDFDLCADASRDHSESRVELAYSGGFDLRLVGTGPDLESIDVLVCC